MTDTSPPENRVNEAGVAPTIEEIQALEVAIGHKVPQAYIDLISDLDMAYPALNKFPVPPNDGDGISFFIPFSKLKNETHTFHYNHGAPYLLPIIDTTCGNYVCVAVDEKRDDYGVVYFWDHELSFDNGPIKIALTAQDFMNLVHADNWRPALGEWDESMIISRGGASPEEIAELARAARVKKDHNI